MVGSPVRCRKDDKLSLYDAVSTLKTPLIFVVAVDGALRNERVRIHFRPGGLSWPQQCRLQIAYRLGLFALETDFTGGSVNAAENDLALSATSPKAVPDVPPTYGRPVKRIMKAPFGQLQPSRAWARCGKAQFLHEETIRNLEGNIADKKARAEVHTLADELERLISGV